MNPTLLDRSHPPADKKLSCKREQDQPAEAPNSRAYAATYETISPLGEGIRSSSNDGSAADLPRPRRPRQILATHLLTPGSTSKSIFYRRPADLPALMPLDPIHIVKDQSQKNFSSLFGKYSSKDAQGKNPTRNRQDSSPEPLSKRAFTASIGKTYKLSDSPISVKRQLEKSFCPPRGHPN